MSSLTALEINTKYLNSMIDAGSGSGDKVLSRIRDLWWKPFLTFYSSDPLVALDTLDKSMNEGRRGLQNLAHEYCLGKSHQEGSAKYTQVYNQFMKSNTGKMFERFAGLSLAYHLKEKGSNYCLWPFRSDLHSVCGAINKNSFSISTSLGSNISYTIPIDADIILFNPSDRKTKVYMISVKSTLKDRFHNVPFWNLLRHAAINNVFPNLSKGKSNQLKHINYIAVCSDLAEEQPDFSRPEGARNLLCLDASLLDGAFVSSSKAKGLGREGHPLGFKRRHPFYVYSSFAELFT
jgi:hypothetical protein